MSPAKSEGRSGMTSFPLFEGMTAADSLSLWSDGPIPASMWAEARQWDRANPLQMPAAKIVRVQMKRALGVKLLAFAIQQAITARCLVEARDLETLGLTARQIRDWKDEALAHVLAAKPGLAEFVMQEAA